MNFVKTGPTRTRYQAVKLYGEGYDEKEIEQITGCCPLRLMDCAALTEKTFAGAG